MKVIYFFYKPIQNEINEIKDIIIRKVCYYLVLKLLPSHRISKSNKC